MFLLLISSLVSGNFTFASSEEGQFPQSIIAASSTDTTPHALELRAIQDGDNAEPRKVSQFKLDMTNVVTAQVNSQLLVFVTDSSVRVLEAKVRTVSDQLIDLVPTIQANAFSLANLPVGVYTLDIIAQKGNAKVAYEGILVINQQPTTIINETTKQIINQEINQNSRVDIDTKIIFKEYTPIPKPPIECKPNEQLSGDGRCVPIYCKDVEGPGGCNCLLHGECEDPNPLPIPICDENTPPGTLCRDEGDYTDCEEGYWDYGSGCEPIEGEEPEPEVCTPDGPPCPPCPEGVEAGWCADEDEQQDFDCGDSDMENDPRCKDGEPVNGSEEEIEPEVVVEELPEEEEEEEPEEKELEE